MWQRNRPTASRTWSVDRSSSALVINEILAHNVAALTLAVHPGLHRTFVEATRLDLAGMSLSNDARVPRKFVFPLGTQLPVAHFSLSLRTTGNILKSHLFTLNAAGTLCSLRQAGQWSAPDRFSDIWAPSSGSFHRAAWRRGWGLLPRNLRCVFPRHSWMPARWRSRMAG